MTPSIDAARLLALLQMSSAGPTARPDPGGNTSELGALSASSFRWMIADALVRAAASRAGMEPSGPPPAGPPESPASSPAVSGTPPAGDPALTATGTDPARALPARETEAIAREARRTGIDPDLLTALRRTENGGPGREFGVLSVAAPGVEQQARIAANTVRNMAARFQRQGGVPVDPATGRYTEAFLRFFSSRYAPRGAANDPLDLNRFHAANLIALYRRVSGETV